jgi:hypothetical protein
MAATLDIYQMLEVIGLSGGNESKAIKFTKGQTPAEITSGRPIIGDTAYDLDLGDIAAGSGFCLYLEALVGSLYVTLGWVNTDPDPSATTSHLYISQGEGYIIPLNFNSTAMPGIGILSNNASGQISYKLIGS